MKKYIGCDLGGTNLRAAIVDVENGSALHHMSIPTLARDGHEVVMQRMAGLFLEVIDSARMSKDEIGGVGIGVPGVLDLDKGEVLFLPNLPGTWPHVPLQATIERLTNDMCKFRKPRAWRNSRRKCPPKNKSRPPRYGSGIFSSSEKSDARDREPKLA